MFERNCKFAIQSFKPLRIKVLRLCFRLMAPDTVIPTSSASPWNYVVFLSYEGEETGNNFASKLYAYLERAKIQTFKHDDQNLKRGEKITAAVMKGIKESKILIVIFSRNDASSIWRLEELAFIMECWEKQLGQKVFPVFLMGVDGSDVRRQKGIFEEPFRLHQERFGLEMVKKWRSAMSAAGDLRGWNLKDVPVPDGDEEKLIESIVEEVSKVLQSEIPVGDSEHPIRAANTLTIRTSFELKVKFNSDECKKEVKKLLQKIDAMAVKTKEAIKIKVAMPVKTVVGEINAIHKLASSPFRRKIPAPIS